MRTIDTSVGLAKLQDVNYTDDEGEPRNAFAFLTKDGNHKVPCSRYGRDTYDCAYVAIAAFVIYGWVNAEDHLELLDWLMGRVVNDSAEIESILRDNEFVISNQYGIVVDDLFE